jgi:hypothetical protein
MASIDNRLEQIESALTPTQAVIAWLDQAQSFDSFEGYARSLIGKPRDEYPLSSLIRQMQASSLARRESKDPGLIQKALRRASRHVIFLFKVCFFVTEEVESRLRPLALSALLSLEGVRSVGPAAINSTDPGEWVVQRFYFERYATEFFSLKAAINFLEDKYFCGHPLLWKGQATELDRHGEVIGEIAETWNWLALFLRLAESRSRGKRQPKSADLGRLELDLEALRKLSDPSGSTRSLVARAKAEALTMIGETDAAIDVLKSLLQTPA